MPAVTTALSAIGLAASIGSTVAGVVGANKEAKAEDKAESARKKAANLDALRRQRQAIREMQQQRAIAVSNATAQGAEAGSGLQGAIGQVTGQGNSNILGIEQQRQLGNEVFAANKQARSARTLQATAEGIGQLGGSLVKNAGTIESIGQAAFG